MTELRRCGVGLPSCARERWSGITLGVVLAVKKNKALDSLQVLRFCMVTVMLDPDLDAGLVKQLGGLFSGAFIRQIRGCHIFILNQYTALRHCSQIGHLEGAFAGAF